MSGKRRWGFRAGMVWAAVVAVTASAEAGDVLSALVARATDAPVAVVGEPIRQESRWENGGIWTYTELGVRRAIGEAVPPTILVRQRGGVVGKIGQQVSHLRLIAPDRAHLLVLWRDPESGLLTPGPGGVLPLLRSEGGSDLVEGLALETVWSALAGVIR